MNKKSKLETEGIIKTRPKKSIVAFFLGFAVLVLCGGIACIVYFCTINSENTDTLKIIILAVFTAVFSFMGFFGYAFVRLNYVIVDNNGVYSHRLFNKTQYYKFDEISYFIYSSNTSILGSLTGYDINNKKIFCIEAINIGTAAVAQRLQEHGIPKKFQ